MKAQTLQIAPATLPDALIDVALIDGETAAAVGGMRISWWLAAVKEGRAPQPVVREPRCTRWRLIDVREFWRLRADAAASNPDTAARLHERATKASAASKVARDARKIGNRENAA